MNRRTALLPCLALLLVAAPTARADVVHLASGGTISGRVIRDDAKGVVVKTPHGRVTLPRHLVARVERQSRGETLIALARERVKAGAYEEAERLYRRAAADADPALAERARTELESVLRARERAKGLRRPPRTPLALPEGVTGRPLAGETLQEQFDRARSALDTGDGAYAARLLEPLATGHPEQRLLRYLYGRALELARRPEAARGEYLAALGQERRDERPVAWLGDLARRRQAGLRPRSSTPGVTRRGWRREAPSPLFAVYAPADRTEPWLVSAPELALHATLEELGLPRHRLYVSGRIQVLVYPDAAALAAARRGERPGLPAGAGHEGVLPAPDGPLWLLPAVAAAAPYREALRHQLAHVVLRETAPEAPAWLREGAACALDPPATRRARRPRLPVDLGAFLGNPAAPAAGPAFQRFCGEAQATFAALERRLGREGALAFGREVGTSGLDEALRRAGCTLEDLATPGE